MFATWFVAQGVDVVRRPASHADDVRRAVTRFGHLLPEGAVRDAVQGRSATELQTLARVHGGAMAAAGGLLALGRAPRTSAVVLALLTAPIVVADLPDKAADRAEPTRARARRERMVTALSMTAGALLVAVDREGRPSLAWRVEHARATKELLASQKRATAGAKATGTVARAAGAATAAQAATSVRAARKNARTTARAAVAEAKGSAKAARRATKVAAAQAKASTKAARAAAEVAAKQAKAQAAVQAKAARAAAKKAGRTSDRRATKAAAKAAKAARHQATHAADEVREAVAA